MEILLECTFLCLEYSLHMSQPSKEQGFQGHYKMSFLIFWFIEQKLFVPSQRTYINVIFLILHSSFWRKGSMVSYGSFERWKWFLHPFVTLLAWGGLWRSMYCIYWSLVSQDLKTPSLLLQGHSLLGNRVTVFLASQVFTSYFTDWVVKGDKKSFHHKLQMI